MRRRVLMVRLDGAGDVLLAGPAVRAVAQSCDVVMLTGPAGEPAARLLPGVKDVLSWRCPWVIYDPPAAERADIDDIRRHIEDLHCDAALILTSFHQSPLPTALLLRMAGIAWIGAISIDYPGSLLDLRVNDPGDIHESQRGLRLAEAAGFELGPDDGGGLSLVDDLPDMRHLTGSAPYVVAHPGCSAPARQWSTQRWAEAVATLGAAGRRVIVTGGPSETALAEQVADSDALNLAGQTNLAELAGVLARADAVVVGNTGPAHLAAAAGTPVVSLFAPTVPAVRWRPFGRHVLLGDQDAACRQTRAITCPVPGHPCLQTVRPRDVVDAVDRLTYPATHEMEVVR
ncbi:glycosyltransferase family 9 protein [Epidermidibacterium keratini]|uniref:Glycosyltransferase family 9 protein n=1 Tax=Epidermidibacterium keratini TaxID=1891644 RepID=A0A7L4YNC2_9ACTN|nr:glycosyltransferase family 9 protein [Epidermidibacterium keratini]QHC00393.1 glycosyltransferase family 9 protein [Epidermidibacterium keratini]